MSKKKEQKKSKSSNKNKTTICPVVVVVVVALIGGMGIGAIATLIINYLFKPQYSHVNDLYRNNYDTVGYNRRIGEYQKSILYTPPKVALELIKDKLLVRAMHSEVFYKNEYAIAMTDIVLPRLSPFYGKYYSFIILSLKRSPGDGEIEKLLHFGHGGRGSEWQNILIFNLCIVNSLSPQAIVVEEQHSNRYMNKIETKIRDPVIQVSFDIYEPFSRSIVQNKTAFFYDEVSAALQSIMEQFQIKGNRKCFYDKKKKKKRATK